MSRIRLTITMEQKILRFLDSIVDKRKIRNRSHAIEYVLNKYFNADINKALILAGGENGPISGLPKSMVQVGRKPVLERTIAQLAASGIKDILISVDKNGQVIRDYFGNGQKFGVNIKYVGQKESGAGTAKALFDARQYFNNQPFILWYGDVLADVDVDGLTHTHLKENKMVTMALTSVLEPGGWGVVQSRGLRIVDLQEKPGKGKYNSFVINSGIYVVDPKVLDVIKKQNHSFEKEILPVLVKDGELCGYMFSGDWFDIGTVDGYQGACKKY